MVTPLDVLEAIAGEFPDEDETPDVVVQENGWLVKGGTDLHTLEQMLGWDGLVSESSSDCASVAGLLLAHFDQMPQAGEVLELHGLRFQVMEVKDYRIELIHIERIAQPSEFGDE